MMVIDLLQMHVFPFYPLGCISLLAYIPRPDDAERDTT